MINEFIDILKKYNEFIKTKIESSRGSKIINSVLSRIGKEPVTDEEIEMFNAEISKLDLDEASKNRIPFIIFLLKNNKELDQTQQGILYSISQKVLAQDVLPYESLIERNNKVIEELSNSETFKNIEDLTAIFNELSKTHRFNIDNRFILDVIREIIIKNHENASKLGINVSVDENQLSEDEYVEKELSDDKKMSEEEIKEILEKYGYSYNLLSKDNKTYLSKYALKERLIEVLDTLKGLGIYIKLNKDTNKTAFCKIVVLSSLDAIKECLTLCNENGISILNFVENEPSVLIPNKVRQQKQSNSGTNKSENKKSVTGALGNFKENLRYLNEHGYNIMQINKKCKNALLINPYILRYNLEMLEDMYGISMKNGKAFTGVLAGSAIKNLDRIIESSPLGYEYAKSNNSKLNGVSLIGLMKIRMAELENCSLLYYLNGKLVKIGENGEMLTDPNYQDDKRVQILKLSDQDVIKEFGQRIPLFLSDEEAGTLKAIIDNSKVNDINVEDNKFIKHLDNNYMLKDEHGNKNEFVYKINSTLISRKKVLRICQALKNNNIVITEGIIKYAISYNSILNENDVNNINNIDFGMNFGGKK